MIFNQMHNAMQTAVNRTTMITLIAEIFPSAAFLILRHMQRMTCKFLNTFILRCRNRYNRNSKKCLHLIDVNGSAIAAHLVHHIQCQHHRYIQFHQLHGQIKISLNVGCIYNINNTCRLFIKNKLP